MASKYEFGIKVAAALKETAKTDLQGALNDISSKGSGLKIKAKIDTTDITKQLTKLSNALNKNTDKFKSSFDAINDAAQAVFGKGIIDSSAVNSATNKQSAAIINNLKAEMAKVQSQLDSEKEKLKSSGRTMRDALNGVYDLSKTSGFEGYLPESINDYAKDFNKFEKAIDHYVTNIQDKSKDGTDALANYAFESIKSLNRINETFSTLSTVSQDKRSDDLVSGYEPQFETLNNLVTKLQSAFTNLQDSMEDGDNKKIAADLQAVGLEMSNIHNLFNKKVDTSATAQSIEQLELKLQEIDAKIQQTIQHATSNKIQFLNGSDISDLSKDVSDQISEINKVLQTGGKDGFNEYSKNAKDGVISIKSSFNNLLSQVDFKNIFGDTDETKKFVDDIQYAINAITNAQLEIGRDGGKGTAKFTDGISSIESHLKVLLTALDAINTKVNGGEIPQAVTISGGNTDASKAASYMVEAIANVAAAQRDLNREKERTVGIENEILSQTTENYKEMLVAADALKNFNDQLPNSSKTGNSPKTGNKQKDGNKQNISNGLDIPNPAITPKIPKASASQLEKYVDNLKKLGSQEVLDIVGPNGVLDKTGNQFSQLESIIRSAQSAITEYNSTLETIKKGSASGSLGKLIGSMPSNFQKAYVGISDDDIKKYESALARLGLAFDSLKDGSIKNFSEATQTQNNEFTALAIQCDKYIEKLNTIVEKIGSIKNNNINQIPEDPSAPIPSVPSGEKLPNQASSKPVNIKGLNKVISELREYTKSLSELTTKIDQSNQSISEKLQNQITKIDSLIKSQKEYTESIKETKNAENSTTNDVESSTKEIEKKQTIAKKAVLDVNNAIIQMNKIKATDQFGVFNNIDTSGLEHISEMIHTSFGDNNFDRVLNLYETFKLTLAGITEQFKTATDAQVQFESVSKAINTLNSATGQMSGTGKRLQDAGLQDTSQYRNLEQTIGLYRSLINVLQNVKDGGPEKIATLGGSIKEWASSNNISNVTTLSDALSVLKDRLIDVNTGARALEKDDKLNSSLIRGKTRVANLTSEIKDYLAANKQISTNSSEYGKFTSLLDQLGKADAAGNVKDLQLQFSRLRVECKNLGLEGDNLILKFKNLFMQHMSTAFVMGALHAVQNAARQVYDSVVQIDTALNQLQIVTRSNTTAMKEYASAAASAAKATGQSTTDILGSMTTYARLGFRGNDPTDLAKYTAMYANTSGSTVDDATTAVTAILKGYGKNASDVEEILSELVKIGNNYAVQASELGTGLANAGSALSSSGNNLEQSIGLLTAANASVQDISKASTMLRTISTRLTGTSAQLEQAAEDGLDVEDAVTNQSKYRSDILAETNGAVDILMEDGKTYKSTFEILTDLSKVWNDLDNSSKNVIINDIAGTRGANVFNSIMSNISDAQGAMEDAQNAEGSLASANDTYMNSIQSHTAQFTAQFQELSSDLLDSNLIKSVTDLGSGFLWMADGMQKAGALYPTIALAIAGISKAGEPKMTGSINVPANTLMATLNELVA